MLCVLCVCTREAIGSLMGQLQEVRSSCGEEEAKVNSLRRELQDTSRELSEALSTINRQVNTHTRTHTQRDRDREFRLVFYWFVFGISIDCRQPNWSPFRHR